MKRIALLLVTWTTVAFAQTAPPPYVAPPPQPYLPVPVDPYAMPTQSVTKPILPGQPPSPRDMIERTRRFPRAPITTPTNELPAIAPLPATATGPRLWHVSPQGADFQPGTDRQPLQTIQRAADLAQPGDTVVVHAGRYAGFQTVRAGAQDAPIRFRAVGQVIIDRNSNQPADHILVRDTDWIIIEGFTVQNAPRAGISVIESSDVVVTNNTAGPNRVWGIFTGFAPRVHILHNRAFGSAEQHGIYVSNSRVAADKPVLRGNECYANKASGIQLNGDCNMGGDGVLDGALIENNSIHDNYSKGLSLISIADAVIRNNLIFENGRESGAGGIHLTDELGCRKPSRRNLIVNNTIVEPRLAAIRLTDGATENIVFNNLLVGRAIVDESGGNHIDDRTNFRAAPEVFVNPATGDYRLRPGVAAIPAGQSQFRGVPAPPTDYSGAARAGLVPTVGACDANCPALPVPRIHHPPDQQLRSAP